VGVQEVRWEEEGIIRARDYNYEYTKEREINFISREHVLLYNKE
jgi:hypothetical protein